MQVIYIGPESREFGGKVGDQRFRVPVAERGEPRLVHFIDRDAEGNEKSSVHTNQEIGGALLASTSSSPRAKDRKLLYEAYDPDKSRQVAQREEEVVTPVLYEEKQPGANAGAKTAQKKG